MNMERSVNFRDVLHSWTQTKTKQTKRLHQCKAVCLAALNTFYCLRFYFVLTTSFVLYFAYLFSLRACKYLSIYLLIFLLFHNCIYNAEFLSPNSNLKMTIERSKRRSFLLLLFIANFFSKTFLIRILTNCSYVVFLLRSTKQRNWFMETRLVTIICKVHCTTAYRK